jgi:hypothetical protein
MSMTLSDELTRISACWGATHKVVSTGAGLSATFTAVPAPLDAAFAAIGALVQIAVVAPARVGAPCTVPLRSGRFASGIGFFARCLPQADATAYDVEVQLLPAATPAAGVPLAVFQLLDEVLGSVSKEPVEALVGYLAYRLDQPRLDVPSRRMLLAEMATLVGEQLAKAQSL